MLRFKISVYTDSKDESSYVHGPIMRCILMEECLLPCQLPAEGTIPERSILINVDTVNV